VGASSASAYEVHDFQAVAIVELGLGPVVAGDNIAVQLHCYTIGLHPKEVHQCGEGEGSRRVKRSFFSVDVKFHWL